MKQNNPFPYSESNKRFHTYDHYVKTRFGGKTVRLPLDGGFTCPNRDGKCGTGGCIYCSAEGSGDFTSHGKSVTEQIALQKAILGKKWPTERCIAYFQAFTSTYKSTEELRRLYEEALSCEGIVGLSVATRPDCLPDDVVALLSELADRTELTVELGLQTANDETAKTINRGYPYAVFEDAFRRLKSADSGIRVGVHLIFGLPDETEEMMLSTVKKVAALRPDEVKIHLLHVIRGTRLAKLYEEGKYTPMERDAYIETVAKALTLLPPETVIGRLTGDGKKETLVAPLWSSDKRSVLNGVDKFLASHGLYQGCESRETKERKQES